MEEKTIWSQIKKFFSERFNLESDQAPHDEIVENIRKGIDFRGTNLWILIFAIVIASVGLNVNSTAVIIGAMLVSPLMGPIMGIGLSLGIDDFEMLKRSFKNFIFAVGVSIVVSTLYFIVTPLSTAQSELLARTTPTIWDVLIATFGGLAGVVAQTRKDRTTPVIPGVAIATALMPPLCTAGFGIATGNLAYFGGAFYLFLINTVFIAFATYFMIRFLKFPRKQLIDPKRAKNVKRSMVLILVMTIVPSVILAYGIVQRSVFENSALKFVTTVMQFERSEVVNTNIVYDRKNGNEIEVTIVGAAVSEEFINSAKAQMTAYGLSNVKLNVRQATFSDKVDNASLHTLLNTNSNIIIEKDNNIKRLEEALDKYEKDTIASYEIAQEIGAINEGVSNVSISRSQRVSTDGKRVENTIVCVVTMKPGYALNEADAQRLKKWLAKRTNNSNVEFIVKNELEVIENI